MSKSPTADAAKKRTRASAAPVPPQRQAEAMEAKSAQAKGVRTQHAIAKSHHTRAQGHAAARTQRTQGRRDSK